MTRKSTYVTMGLVDGLVNQFNRTAVVKNANQLNHTLHIAPSTLEERSALGIKTLVRSK
ncbi:hypothetical protein [Microcoleus sp. A006_D1]|uniref:hypothetical protein n=1 Tax=Microcoleus sp. A006_D1 TaxID=3055267 RepID=UPI002FD4489E